PRDNTASLPDKTGGWTRAVVWGSAAVILVFGLFPDAIVSFTRRSTPTLTTDAAATGVPAGIPRTTSAPNSGAVALHPNPVSSGK
ncbi:MAG TPA: hypothetical protein VIM36_06590, partial [Gemmatimonadaceae bacterium]